MKETGTANNDCGCDGDCCPPKPKPKWMKYISILVFVIALSIILIKVLNSHHSGGDGKIQAVSEKSSCCDTSATRDSTKKPCCSKDGK